MTIRSEDRRAWSTIVSALAAVSTLAAVSLAPVAAQASTLPDPAAHLPLVSDLTDSVGDYDGTAVGDVTFDDGLTLTGGSAEGPYVELLPEVVTDQGETLTISSWIRRDVPDGNYSALWFGTPAVAGVPTHYWLLNPSNPGGYVKSVFTDGTAPEQPWSTEVGAAGSGSSLSAAEFNDEWAQYTTVIDATSITTYVNGEPVGDPVQKSLEIADFDGEISAYIGASNYASDPTYRGSLRDVRVYDEALTDQAVQDLYSGDIAAPDAPPAQIEAAVTNSRVTVSWEPPASTDGFRPVTGYDVMLSGAGGELAAQVDGTTTQTTFGTVANGEYELSVQATNSVGAGPAGRGGTVTVASTLSPAAEDLQAIEIPHADDVRGHLTLPTEGELNGTPISWSSEPGGVISTESDGEIAAGVVTRGEQDVSVTLTASVAGDHRDIPVTVRARTPQEEHAAYLFTYFNGEGGPEGESVRFAMSQGTDALQWHDLNDGEPVLRSEYGTLGVRDPFIIRSHEGDRFYLLATDLNTEHTGFGEAQRTGSRYLEIWESTDLVHWSEQRHVRVSTELAGNTWAPEAFYDPTLEAYVVYWASNLYDSGEEQGRDNTASYNRMMYSVTRDFVTFTEPQVWIDSERREGGFGTIDSTILQQDGAYYRFTKDEGTMTIFLQQSDRLRATVTHEQIGADFPTTSTPEEWDLITTEIGVGQEYVNPTGETSTFTQGEGPTVFPAIEDEDRWYLFVDQPSYHGGAGYAAMTSTDQGENWEVLDSSGLPSSPRHGTVIPVTRAEHDQLLAAFQPELLVTEVEPVDLTVSSNSDDLALPETVRATIGGEQVQVGIAWDDVDLSGLTEPGQSVEVLGWLDNASATPAVARITLARESAPTLALSASQVAAGDTLTVTGTGFAAGAPVELWLHSEPVLLETDAATEAGNLEHTVTIPAETEVGEHTLVAEYPGGTVSATLDVTQAADPPTEPGDESADDGQSAEPEAEATGPDVEAPEESSNGANTTEGSGDELAVTGVATLPLTVLLILGGTALATGILLVRRRAMGGAH